MGSYIRVAQNNITSIAKELSQKAQHDLRFGLVCYRDHPPAEQSYATRVFEFTSSLDDMSRNVGTMKAQGGGDTPESVACALNAALRLPWRPNSVKVSQFHFTFLTHETVTLFGSSSFASAMRPRYMNPSILPSSHNLIFINSTVSDSVMTHFRMVAHVDLIR